VPHTYVIGDIHGQLGHLKTLLGKLSPQEGDDFIFLGDYIDRGPRSRGVLDYLMDLAERFPCVFLKGNHEDMFLEALRQGSGTEAANLWINNGGLQTLQDFGRAFDDPMLLQTTLPKYVYWMQGLPTGHETVKYYFVHASLNVGRSFAETPDRDRMWGRNPYWHSDWDWGKKVIFGHTIRLEGPWIMSNRIGIDTGSFLPQGRLTALVLPEEAFVYSVDGPALPRHT
jgi:serine/threonine protein phosphatase 1